jgi:hypothetical protein
MTDATWFRPLDQCWDSTKQAGAHARSVQNSASAREVVFFNSLLRPELDKEATMDQERALSILKTLADGMDPTTGEQYPSDSPYQRPDTIRALFWVVRNLETPARPQKQTAPRAEGAPSNAGRPWSEEEDVQLGKAFDAGGTIDQLAQEHKRSRWAIEARLVKLGKIAAPQSGFTPRYPMGKKNAASNSAAGARS